jgi:hypothetical protein
VGQALVTAVGIGLIGIVAAAVFGLTAVDGADISRHISFGIFSTMITLLAHSMMMFYLIGKGKAVKDAMKEGGYEPDGTEYRQFVARFSQARKPVFSIATYAMAATMITAILGASVDTGVLPPVVHAMIAYGAVACNLAAIKIEVDALAASSRVVDDVNHFLGS